MIKTYTIKIDTEKGTLTKQNNGFSNIELLSILKNVRNTILFQTFADQIINNTLNFKKTK